LYSGSVYFLGFDAEMIVRYAADCIAKMWGWKELKMFMIKLRLLEKTYLDIRDFCWTIMEGYPWLILQRCGLCW
jgi:hypothetical protein